MYVTDSKKTCSIGAIDDRDAKRRAYAFTLAPCVCVCVLQCTNKSIYTLPAPVVVLKIDLLCPEIQLTSKI